MDTRVQSLSGRRESEQLCLYLVHRRVFRIPLALNLISRAQGSDSPLRESLVRVWITGLKPFPHRPALGGKHK